MFVCSKLSRVKSIMTWRERSALFLELKKEEENSDDLESRCFFLTRFPVWFSWTLRDHKSNGTSQKQTVMFSLKHRTLVEWDIIPIIIYRICCDSTRNHRKLIRMSACVHLKVLDLKSNVMDDRSRLCWSSVQCSLQRSLQCPFLWTPFESLSARTPFVPLSQPYKVGHVLFSCLTTHFSRSVHLQEGSTTLRGVLRLNFLFKVSFVVEVSLDFVTIFEWRRIWVCLICVKRIKRTSADSGTSSSSLSSSGHGDEVQITFDWVLLFSVFQEFNAL